MATPDAKSIVGIQVDASALADGDALVFNGSSGKFEAGATSGGTFTEVSDTAQTTDGTPENVVSFTLADNTVYNVEMVVVGRGTGGVERAGYRDVAVVYRQAGGNATIEGTADSLQNEATNGSLSRSLVVNGHDIEGQVTGLSGTTINWRVVLKLLPIS